MVEMADGTVAIVTLSGNNNYGNKLQLYACIRIYQKIGLNPVYLSYKVAVGGLAFVRHAVRRLVGQETPVSAEALSTSGRTEAFMRFNENIPQHDIQKPNSALANKYDLFSVGSDQVWNTSYIELSPTKCLPLKLYRYLRQILLEHKFIYWYFLKFCKPNQRITMSPSLSMDNISSRGERILKRGLVGFSNISVREQRGAEIIRECTGRDAEVTCDPTIILSAEEWRDVADDRLTPKGSYVLAYLLGGSGGEATEVLEQVSKSGQLPVISLSDRMQPGEPEAGPAEFISLIDHASHVVTDSFHASVFSMLLKTPVTIVHRQGEGTVNHMFSRIESLAETYGLKDKIYGSDSFDLACAGEYPMASDAICRERACFMRHMARSLTDAGFNTFADRALNLC